MTIKAIRVYQTSDGKNFNNQKEAKEHENVLESMEQLRYILRTSLSTGRSESVLKQILLEQTAIREVLVRYNKRKPKQRCDA